MLLTFLVGKENIFWCVYRVKLYFEFCCHNVEKSQQEIVFYHESMLLENKGITLRIYIIPEKILTKNTY